MARNMRIVWGNAWGKYVSYAPLRNGLFGVPLFLKQAPYVELGAPIPGFNYKLKQMPKQGDIHGK